MINKVINFYWYSSQGLEPPDYSECCIKSFEKMNPDFKIKFHKEINNTNVGIDNPIIMLGKDKVYKIDRDDYCIATRKLKQISENNNEISSHLDVFNIDKISDSLLEQQFLNYRVFDEYGAGRLNNNEEFIFYNYNSKEKKYSKLFIFRSYYYLRNKYSDIYNKYHRIRNLFYRNKLEIDIFNDIFKDLKYLFYNSPILHFESGIQYVHGFYKMFLNSLKS